MRKSVVSDIYCSTQILRKITQVTRYKRYNKSHCVIKTMCAITSSTLLSCCLRVHGFSIKAWQVFFISHNFYTVCCRFLLCGSFLYCSSHVVFSQIPLQRADKSYHSQSLQQWQNFDPRRRPHSFVDSSQLLLIQQNQLEKSQCVFGFVHLRRGLRRELKGRFNCFVDKSQNL